MLFGGFGDNHTHMHSVSYQVVIVFQLLFCGPQVLLSNIEMHQAMFGLVAQVQQIMPCSYGELGWRILRYCNTLDIFSQLAL